MCFTPFASHESYELRLPSRDSRVEAVRDVVGQRVLQVLLQLLRRGRRVVLQGVQSHSQLVILTDQVNTGRVSQYSGGTRAG